MADLPLKKLRNFGGKLGAELAELGCSTAGQVGSCALTPERVLVRNGVPVYKDRKGAVVHHAHECNAWGTKLFS